MGSYAGLDSQQRFERFADIVRLKLASADMDSPVTHNFLLIQALCLGMVDRAPLALCELLFTANILEDIKRYAAVFQHFCNDNLVAQRFLIGGVQRTIARHKDTLMPYVSTIFKALYEEDILDKSVIIEWFEGLYYVSADTASEIHKMTEPLVQYLKKTEDEYIDELFSILQ